jgi:hypothetical protein
VFLQDLAYFVLQPLHLKVPESIPTAFSSSYLEASLIGISDRGHHQGDLEQQQLGFGDGCIFSGPSLAGLGSYCPHRTL